MDSQDYQKEAARTLTTAEIPDLSDQTTMLVWTALGLTGEAGEVADLVKKGIFHQHGLDKTAIKKELGDVLWYITAMCTLLDLDLEEVMEVNIQKLQRRYPNGFSTVDSKQRMDLGEGN